MRGRKLCGYDLNGWCDRAARNWCIGPDGEEIAGAETVHVTGAVLQPSVVRTGDGRGARWIGGAQASLAPHGRGGGWGDVGAPDRRETVRALMAAPRPATQPLAAALAGLASGARVCAIALDDHPARTEDLQEALLAAVAQGRLGRGLLVWRSVLAVLGCLAEDTTLLAPDEGLSLGVINHVGEGFTLQKLRLRREMGRGRALFAPERRRMAQPIDSPLGYAGLFEAARAALIAGNAGPRGDWADHLQTRAALALGQPARAELLRTERGDFVQIDPPEALAMPPAALPPEIADKIARCDLILFESLTSGPLRDTLVDPLRAVCGGALIDLPEDIIARGALEAARRHDEGEPVYFDFLPQISTIVLGQEGARSHDLIDPEATLPAGRIYRSAEPAKFAIQAGQAEFSVHLRKELSPWPRKARVEIGAPVSDIVPVSLSVEQAPAAGRARLLIDAPKLSRQFTIDWEGATEVHRPWEDLVAELDGPAPTIPKRLVLPCGMDLWEEVCERFDIDALSQRFIAATSALDPARRQARAALDALAIKGQSFDAVPTCLLTLEEAEALLDTVQQVTLRHDAARRAREELQAELAERAARIGRIKATSGLIEDAQAQSLRAERDDLWAEHRAKLNAETAAGFEEAMLRVDTAMDLRLSHAADLGTLRQHEQDLVALEARACLMEEQITALAAERQAALDSLTAAARQAGIGAPMIPAAFVAWLRKRGTAAQAATELRRLQEDHRETFDRAERVIEGLAPLLRRDAPRFEDLVAEAKAILTGQRAQKEKLRTARSRGDDLMREREKRVARLAEQDRKAAQLRRDWGTRVTQLLTEAVNASLLEASLKPLHDLRALDTERIALERQVLGMEADQEQFSKRVRDLGARAGAEGSEAPRADYDALVAKVDAAVAAEEKSLDLAQRIAAQDQALCETRRTLDDIRLAVEKMARLFPEGVETGSLEALRQAVSTAARVIGDRGRLAQLERDVLVALALSDLDAAREALAGASEAGLRAQLEEVEADLETAEDLYKTKIEARAAAAEALRAIGGDAEVARLVERKTTLELEMQEAALRHLELSLGHHLADAAILRYRDTHRSAMMQATETAFAELTNGAYSQLRTQIDGASETLLAFDSKGMAKQAQDMSKGTRFQLYLALRAAAYEQLAQQGTSLPFFCDDIFETFDEDRTRSACRVMERLGRRGQAIYLTHHRHVVDIAREVCADRVQIHRIGA